MAAADSEMSSVDQQFDSLSNASEEGSFRACSDLSRFDEEYIRRWGFRLKELYRLGLKFYKEKEGKAVQLSYQDKLKLVALTKQVSVGKFNPDNSPALGVLDVIGRDRRVAWQALGDMETEDAMVNFIELLNQSCALFKPFIQAHKADIDNKKRLEEEEEIRKRKEIEMKRLEEESKSRDQEERARQEAQKKQIQEALNQQTYAQFKAYAEQQFPNDIHQQELLVKQLQEEHYHQYMEQLTHSVKFEVKEETSAPNHVHITNGDAIHTHESDEEETHPPATVSMASMWTKKDVKEFKESIRKEGGDSIIKVGHGETVTVRVPTSEEGTCLFWEFATDYYDIGFGVYFEWTKSKTTQVSVHVSESEDEDDYGNDDDDDEDEFDGRILTDDVERGPLKPITEDVHGNRPPLSVIVPIYRRDCQDEVFAGSHAYPGQGVYLLKFDNSYSLWRSKTLYYRVYYTR